MNETSRNWRGYLVLLLLAVGWTLLLAFVALVVLAVW